GVESVHRTRTPQGLLTSCTSNHRTIRAGRAVRLHELDQLDRVAQGGRMPAADLVRLDVETRADNGAQPIGREEAVVPAEDEMGGHVRPRTEGPRLAARRLGLATFLRRGLSGQARIDVVIEDPNRSWVLRPRHPPPGGVPHL